MLKSGDDAPGFELRDQEGKLWRLEDLRGQKVVLYFYPADDTPGCTKESCDFRDSYPSWQGAGYTILGISPQDTGSKKRFASKYGLPFPLLADETTEIARAYDAYKDTGAEWDGVPLKVKRSTFVIDAEGKIEHALYGVSAKDHVERLRQTLEV